MEVLPFVYSSGKYLNPDSGEAMTLGRAVDQGHLAPKTQWRAYSYKTQQTAGLPSPGSVVSSASRKVLPHFQKYAKQIYML